MHHRKSRFTVAARSALGGDSSDEDGSSKPKGSRKRSASATTEAISTNTNSSSSSTGMSFVRASDAVRVSTDAQRAEEAAIAAAVTAPLTDELRHTIKSTADWMASNPDKIRALVLQVSSCENMLRTFHNVTCAAVTVISVRSAFVFVFVVPPSLSSPSVTAYTHTEI